MNRPSEHSPGPWTIWGDSKEPLLEDVSEQVMKTVVHTFTDNGRDEVYGENDEGVVYEEHPRLN